MSSTTSSDISDSEDATKECRLTEKIKQIKSRIREADNKIQTMKKIADKGEEAIMERINVVESLQHDIEEKGDVLMHLQKEKIKDGDARHKLQSDTVQTQANSAGQFKQGLWNRSQSLLPDIPPQPLNPPIHPFQHSWSCQDLLGEASDWKVELEGREAEVLASGRFPSWNERVKTHMEALEKQHQQSKQHLPRDPRPCAPMVERFIQIHPEPAVSHRVHTFPIVRAPPFNAPRDDRIKHLEQLQSLASKLRSSEEQRSSLQEKQGHVEAENLRLREDVGRLMAALESTRDEGRSTREQLEEARMRLRECEMNLDGAKAENERLESKIARKKMKLKEAHSRAESLNSALKVAHGGRGSIELLKREVTTLMEERMHLEGRLKTKEEEVEDTRKRFQELKDELKDAKLSFQMLERELNLLAEDKKKLQMRLLASSNPSVEGALLDLNLGTWSTQDKDVREATLLRRLLKMERDLKHFKDSWRMERRRNELLRRRKTTTPSSKENIAEDDSRPSL